MRNLPAKLLKNLIICLFFGQPLVFPTRTTRLWRFEVIDVIVKSLGGINSLSMLLILRFLKGSVKKLMLKVAVCLIRLLVNALSFLF